MFDVLFYLLIVLLISDCYCLDDAFYDHLQYLEEQDSEQQQVKRSKCP
jgi:hypothetical protein